MIALSVGCFLAGFSSALALMIYLNAKPDAPVDESEPTSSLQVRRRVILSSDDRHEPEE